MILPRNLGEKVKMKTQREKRLPPAAKVIIAAAIVIGIPLVEFFWWMRFVHLGVPYYEADSYEELDETCSDAPSYDSAGRKYDSIRKWNVFCQSERESAKCVPCRILHPF